MRNMKDARIRQWPATAPKEIRLSSAGVGSISEHEAKLGPLAVLNYVDVYVTCVCVCACAYCACAYCAYAFCARECVRVSVRV